MCGIAGFYGCPDLSRSRALEAMAAAIAHRGPDGINLYHDPSGAVGLASARLAIIDLANGTQPMRSTDGRHILVFNGEIYNFLDLRKELIALGNPFQTNSDTETVLHAYRQWGLNCVTRLSGMFGFAIFDTHEQTLFLARDRTGIKPLYYYLKEGRFVFGSELKAVMCAGIVPRRIHPQALADYCVLGYPLAPATFFADCYELKPGSWLQLSRNGARWQQYWNWRYQNGNSRDSGDLCRSIESELMTTIREHLVADVPVGAFLSGGIDSSLLVSLTAKKLNRNLKTFTVKFGEKQYDESEYARSVARYAGTDHTEIEIDNGSYDLDLIGRIIDQFDQPFADSSAIPTYLLCREVRKHVKVAISGDGGDEMFGGYPRFRYAMIAERVGKAPDWSLRCLERLNESLRWIWPDKVRQARHLIRSARDRQDRLLVLSCYVYPDDLHQIFQPEVAALLGRYRPALTGNCQGSPGGADFVEATVNKVLPSDYLRKVDIMSSAHGLEVRVPFLGDRILESAAHIPASQNFSWSGNKLLLRQLASRHLPAAIANKRKWGFGVPLDSMLGVHGRHTVAAELSGSAHSAAFFNRHYVDTLLKQFANGERTKAQISRWSLYQRVYMMWSLERWLSKWRPTL